MKLSICLALAMCTTSVLASSNIVKEGFFINDSSKNFIKEIHAQGTFTVDHPTRKGYEVYGPKGLKSWLQKNSPYPFYSLNSKNKDKALSTYPSPEEIEAKLKRLQKESPNIFKLFSIGKSVNGRELWVMKVSDNVNVDEVEPEFKYVANMHGDEIVGREVMVSLLEEISSNYKKKDKQTTELVNNTEIFIMPSLNPDGAAERRRGNGNWRDLNRDFPDPVRDSKSTKTSIFDNAYTDHQKETLAMMSFQEKRNFALSANFHGGTEVVNYPWDTQGQDFPYKDLIVELSREYAVKIPSMRDNREFIDGIVNGYEWYEVNGGMQDWSYFWHNDLQVTIELSHSKWPTYDLVQSYYDKNRDSLFDYMKSVHQGVGVKLRDKSKFDLLIYRVANGKQTLLDTIAVDGSEFYKVLPVGQYKIHVKSKSLNQKFDIEVKKDQVSENGNFVDVI